MVGFRLAERCLGLASTVVLARLLVPEDFGLIAMAMSVIAAIELIGAFGFDNALIAHPAPERRHYDSAFTLNVLLGIACAVVVIAAATPTAAFFADPRIVRVMIVLAFAWVAQGFENIGTVTFRRNLEFHREFLFLTSKRMISFCVTLIAAFWLRNYWALVIGAVSGRVATVVFSYVYHSYRPRFTLHATRELMGFSMWMFATNALGFVLTRLSTFVVGRLHGAHALGLYTMAYEIGTLPTSELLAPVNRAMFPNFAKLAHDAVQIRRAFLDVLGSTALLAIPAAFGIAATAEPLVLVFLTSKWLEAVPILKVLAFTGAVTALTSTNQPVYMAIGRPHITAAVAGMRVLVLVPAMIWAGTGFGTVGVAWAELVTGLLFFPVSMVILQRILDVRVAQLLAHMWRPLVAAAVMFVVVRSTMQWLQYGPGAWPASGALLAGIATGMATYVVCIAALCMASAAPDAAELRLVRYLREKRARPGA